MTPAQFLARVKRREIPPVCLFLGQEGGTGSGAGKRAGGGAGAAGDAGRVAEFAGGGSGRRAVDVSVCPERLIFVIRRGGGDAAIQPGDRCGSEDEDEEDGDAPAGRGWSGGVLEAYVKSPTPGVTLVFEASRWDFEGDDKAKSGPRAEVLSGDSGRGGVSAFHVRMKRAGKWTASRRPRT